MNLRAKKQLTCNPLLVFSPLYSPDHKILTSLLDNVLTVNPLFLSSQRYVYRSQEEDNVDYCHQIFFFASFCPNVTALF